MKKCFAVKDVVMMLQVLAQCVMLRVVVIYKYYIPERVIVRMLTLRK